MVDRRINIVERVNNDVGHLLAHADDLINGYAKNVQVNQKTDLISAYNKQEAEWFGTYASYRALLGFYFAREDVSAEFAKIVDATQ